MTALFGELLVTRARTHRHGRWTRTQLDTYQQRMLARLRDHAARRSPFYADQHRGMQSASLAQLPPLTKTQLMAQWDRLVTSPVLRLDSVTRRLQDLESLGGDPGQPWQGRWWTAATAGSTGQRGVFVWNRREWIRILSSYARVNDWAQVKVGPRRPVPTAIVSTRNPAHQSAVVGASLRNPLVPTLRLDATQPIADLVEALNRFQPRLLVCYASMLTPLAEAQTAGNLHIAPEKVITASEEQLPPARRAAIDAWGVQVIDTYAATETATIASTCSHGSMHLYEDFVIIEPVDNTYRPVPDCQLADRLLATVLFSRTLPLIRYELTDSIRLATQPCTCGLPFRCLDTVAGRTEATLRMHSRTGEPVLIQPGVFHDALEPVAVHGWQVQQTTEGITVRIVDPDQHVDLHQITRRLRAGLAAAGVSDDIHVDITAVQGLARTPLGKAPLIIGQKQERPGGEGSR